MFLFTLYTLSIIILNKSSMIDQCSNDTESLLPTYLFLLSGFLWMQPLHAPPPPHHHGNHAAGKPLWRSAGPQRLLLTARDRAKCRLKTQLAACWVAPLPSGNGMAQLRLRLNALVFFFFAWIKLMELDLLLTTPICMLIFKTW